MINLEDIKQKAQAATKGEWIKRTHSRYPPFVQAPKENAEHGYDIELLGEDESQYSTREQDIDYIVATQPQVILELIALVEQSLQPQAQPASAQDSQPQKSIFLQNLHYFSAQTDGTYRYPAGSVGDLLKQAKREIESLCRCDAKRAAALKDAERYRLIRELTQMTGEEAQAVSDAMYVNVSPNSQKPTLAEFDGCIDAGLKYRAAVLASSSHAEQPDQANGK